MHGPMNIYIYKCYWDRFCSELFGFLLSGSSHHCSMLIHSPTTDDLQSHWERHFIKLVRLFLSWSLIPHPAHSKPTRVAMCLSDFLIDITFYQLPRLFISNCSRLTLGGEILTEPKVIMLFGALTTSRRVSTIRRSEYENEISEM